MGAAILAHRLGSWTGPLALPTGFTALPTTVTTQIQLRWFGVPPHQTRVYRDGTLLTTLAAGVESFLDTGRTSGQAHDYQLATWDGATEGTKTAAIVGHALRQVTFDTDAYTPHTNATPIGGGTANWEPIDDAWLAAQPSADYVQLLATGSNGGSAFTAVRKVVTVPAGKILASGMRLMVWGSQLTGVEWENNSTYQFRIRDEVTTSTSTLIPTTVWSKGNDSDRWREFTFADADIKAIIDGLDDHAWSLELVVDLTFVSVNVEYRLYAASLDVPFRDPYAAPTSFVVTPGIESSVLTWVDAPGFNLHYEYEDNDGPSLAGVIVNGGSVPHTSSKQFRIRAVDPLGSPGAWTSFSSVSNPIPATPVILTVVPHGAVGALGGIVFARSSNVFGTTKLYRDGVYVMDASSRPEGATYQQAVDVGPLVAGTDYSYTFKHTSSAAVDSAMSAPVVMRGSEVHDMTAISTVTDVGVGTSPGGGTNLNFHTYVDDAWPAYASDGSVTVTGSSVNPVAVWTFALTSTAPLQPDKRSPLMINMIVSSLNSGTPGYYEVEVLQGTTSIAIRTPTITPVGEPIPLDLRPIVLTAPEQALITDITQLRIRVTVYYVNGTGGNKRLDILSVAAKQPIYNAALEVVTFAAFGIPL